MKDILELKAEFYRMMKEYNFMKRESERLQHLMTVGIASAGARLVASYGDEAGMPSAHNNVKFSAKELDTMNRRDRRRFERLCRIDNEIEVLEYVFDILTDKILASIYDMSLDGDPLRVIADHQEVSKDKAKEMKDRVVEIAVSNERIQTFLIDGVLLPEAEFYNINIDKIDKSDKIDKNDKSDKAV